MIKLLIVTGLRISELTNLKIRDVSTDATQMIVRGKCNKERIVFVPNEELQDAFQRYCMFRAEHGSLKSPLFLNAVGRRLRSQTFRKRLRVLIPSLGDRAAFDPAPVPAHSGDTANRGRYRYPYGSGPTWACKP